MVVQTTIIMATILSFEEQYNLLTGRIFMYITRFLNQNFKAAGIDITKEQWTVLAVLWQQDGISQQAIADETGRDKPSTTRLLDNLEKLGYIERRPDNTDRRINNIHLTRAGIHSEKRIMKAVEETFAMLSAGISDKEKETIRKVFNTIYKNLEK